ncbi:xylulose 5-phosphate/phosphate translocator, chloroplastic-like [Dioscorea cayenensis subsp. rotundata]|uniref:Xylulose 5-phosphate/phosphate translocator, chloroplastic-like n=1 Tax=Dioscorea cayennensis subsp. rotundata TaxID=55577 RepID=A0AB40B1Q4_DIOCR|nr:xylulose 5-phosphate/phosphate translocator, chloroplastic-like [Dioscorea cayenensis subsp. rotundata]
MFSLHSLPTISAIPKSRPHFIHPKPIHGFKLHPNNPVPPHPLLHTITKHRLRLLFPSATSPDQDSKLTSTDSTQSESDPFDPFPKEEEDSENNPCKPPPEQEQEKEQEQEQEQGEKEDQEDDGEEKEEQEKEKGDEPIHLKSTTITPPQSPTTNNSNLQLALVFGLWYFQNVVFNIYNKKVLNLFPFPWLLASFQLLVGSIWMSILWFSGLQPFPRVNKRFLSALLVPALFHTIGHISACVAFSKVTVSFTHVIKASEPVFSVILSALHGQFYPIHIWLSVLPIVAGCSLAAITEVSFNVHGLWGALISNVGFVLRNIYSKQSLYDFKHINGLNLYGFITIASLLYLVPVAVLVEGSKWVDGFQMAVMAAPAPWSFYSWVVLSGIFYHLYNQSSYQALDKISPLTFSVGNTMKRVVVIVSSVLVFRNPIMPLNALGSAIAIFGTFLYSQASMIGKKQKKKDDDVVADQQMSL